MSASEDDVINFIREHFSSPSVNEVFPRGEFDKFLQLVKESNEIAAAKEYTEVTGQSIAVAYLAVKVAERL